MLRSLERQTVASQMFEVVMVAANRHVRNWLDQYESDLQMLVIDAPATAATIRHTAGVARNAGVQHARSDRIMFVDADCILSPGCIEQHCQLLDERRDQIVCGRAPELPFPAQSRLLKATDIDYVAIHAAAGKDYRDDFLPGDDPAIPCSWEHYYSCNASLYKSTFAAAGGFDTSGFRCHDIDLGYKPLSGFGQYEYATARRVNK